MNEVPRWWLICVVVAGVGLVVTVLVVIDPALSFAFNAPQLRAVLETAVTIVGGLVASLAFGRYRRRRCGGDLAIVLALAILALDYPLLKAFSTVLGNGFDDTGAWLYLVAHACSAGLLCWASGQQYETAEAGVATGEDEAGWLSRPTPIYSVAAAGLSTLVLLCFLGFDPDATRTSPAVTTASQLFASPGVSAVRLLCFSLFIFAAIRFSAPHRVGADALMGWLSVGCVLLAIGDLEYGLFPPITHSEIHLGDVFRLAAMQPDNCLIERGGDQLGLVCARRVVGIAHRGLDVAVTHPFLERADRDAGRGHLCSERVSEVVEAVGLVEPRGT